MPIVTVTSAKMTLHRRSSRRETTEESSKLNTLNETSGELPQLDVDSKMWPFFQSTVFFYSKISAPFPSQVFKKRSTRYIARAFAVRFNYSLVQHSLIFTFLHFKKTRCFSQVKVIDRVKLYQLETYVNKITAMLLKKHAFCRKHLRNLSFFIKDCKQLFLFSLDFSYTCKLLEGCV